MVCISSVLADNLGLVEVIITTCTHTLSHFLLEINLGKLVTLLSVLNLLVSLVNQVIACGDVVVSIVLDTLLSILSVKIELFNDFIVQLLLERHLLLPREVPHVSVSIFYLK